MLGPPKDRRTLPNRLLVGVGQAAARKEGDMKRTLSFSIALFLILCQPLAAQRRSEAVEVKVDRLEPTPVGVSITLRALNSKDAIHMMIGFSEGESIARAMRHQKTARPMTHDLLKSFLERNGWRVQKVLIRDLASGTFLADLTVEKDHETQVYDTRPSDAMAIGLRFDAKIFVSAEVFEQQRKNEEVPQQKVKPSEPETLRL